MGSPPFFEYAKPDASHSGLQQRASALLQESLAGRLRPSLSLKAYLNMAMKRGSRMMRLMSAVGLNLRPDTMGSSRKP